MVDIVTIKKGPSLVPATGFDAEELDRIKDGVSLQTRITRPRSQRQQRWYWALLSVVAEGVGLTREELHARTKFKAGLVRQIFIENGVMVVDLGTTKFPENGGVDQIAFQEYLDIAIEVIFRDFLPGVKRKDVFAQVEKLVGPRPE